MFYIEFESNELMNEILITLSKKFVAFFKKSLPQESICGFAMKSLRLQAHIHCKVSAAIEKAYSSKGLDVHVVATFTSQLAVATGAVMWHQNKGKMKGR